MTTIYSSIGNSDDKLTQKRWSVFAAEFITTVTEDFDTTIHGVWFSRPDDEYQNACVCFDIDPADIPALKDELAEVAGLYQQDSIAWAQVDVTEFIKPNGAQP